MTTTLAENQVDRIYSEPQKTVPKFKFNQQVASVFPNLIERSVPGYVIATRILGIIASSHLKPESRCYDLGCGLGAATQAVLDAAGTSSFSIIGVDSSRDMLDGARTKVTDTRASFQYGDLRSFPLKECDVVMMSFSLLFVPIRHRAKVLQNVRSGLKPGGILILSEKVESNTEFDEFHVAFRKSNQYSDLEIDQANKAFKKVLHPESLIAHMIRLRKAGFSDPRVWFQCLNWVSILATG